MEDDICFCCKMPLCKNDTEKHHFPISKSNGGDVTVPICITCHNLVDRKNLADWPVWFTEEIFELVLENKKSRVFNLLVLKMFKMINQLELERKRVQRKDVR